MMAAFAASCKILIVTYCERTSCNKCFYFFYSYTVKKDTLFKCIKRAFVSYRHMTIATLPTGVSEGDLLDECMPDRQLMNYSFTGH